MLSLVCAACSAQGPSDAEKDSGLKENAAKPAEQPPAASQAKAEIPDYVLSPYTPSDYPVVFEKYGSRIADLERFRRAAAEKAAGSPSCDKVAVAEVSDRGSINDLQFFVDCENATRFRFSETELASGSPVRSESQKAYGRTEAAQMCKRLIENNVVHPSTLGVNLFDVDYQKFETTGAASVTMNFKAKNSFGVELKYKARCLFQPGDPNGEITIQERPS